MNIFQSTPTSTEEKSICWSKNSRVPEDLWNICSKGGHPQFMSIISQYCIVTWDENNNIFAFFCGVKISGINFRKMLEKLRKCYPQVADLKLQITEINEIAELQLRSNISCQKLRNCDCGSASFKLRNCDCGPKKKVAHLKFTVRSGHFYFE